MSETRPNQASFPDVFALCKAPRCLSELWAKTRGTHFLAIVQYVKMASIVVLTVLGQSRLRACWNEGIDDYHNDWPTDDGAHKTFLWLFLLGLAMAAMQGIVERYDGEAVAATWLRSREAHDAFVVLLCVTSAKDAGLCVMQLLHHGRPWYHVVSFACALVLHGAVLVKSVW